MAKLFLGLPTLVMADMSNPFRVILSHFPFVAVPLDLGFSWGEPGPSPATENVGKRRRRGESKVLVGKFLPGLLEIR